ncbi:IPT/TIG domain-containing protein [Janthinobacterium psychrotolerans]|uniref:IPT/TIG domain-containing protein n=1 Tax=Janthinobacterium psychrotolerans TaxID=1747903 RepID=A0A1A7C1V9_9BURK|nr:IPT/TIG domain-containing protein [Janthinobacterium psychrotolerans]OBV38994.1 IPT/TIG domain-containing protein [Janthinobacterium psychrotolerans]
MKNHLLIVSLAMLGLSACGGGGGGGASTAVATTATPAVVSAIASVSANTAAIGASLTVTGSNLDRVTAFQVGGVTLAASAVSATSATLTMPATPVSGALTLVTASGTVATSQAITAYLPLTAGELTPAAGIAGTSVSITGAGMANVTAVVFANGTAAAVQGHTDNSVTFVVPVGATTGQLTVRGTFNEALTSAAFTVLPTVSVTSISTAISGGNVIVTVAGSNLDQVNGAAIGSTAATIVSASASELRVSAPSTATGNLMLSSPSRAAVNAGTVAAFTLGAIDFSQVLNLSASDAALRLTRGKPAAVRVSVLGTLAGRSSPTVTLAASSSTGVNLGSLVLSGPATLPTTRNAYSFDGNFSVALPASWIQPGLQVRVTAVGNDGTQVSQQATPAVSSAARMRLVLVPLTTSDGTSVLPDPEVIRAALVRVYPYALDDITVTRRVPLDVGGSSAVDSWWSTTLPKIEAARSQEDSSAFYYGFVSQMSASRTAGLAYISDRTTGVSSPSAMGLDAAATRTASVDAFGNAWPEWLTTMIHEIGHNHSLRHVACGSPTDAVTDYPYANGDLGSQPLYNSNYGATIGQLSQASYSSGGGTRQMKDVMSYCSGAWFSDYSYARVQQFLESYAARLARTGRSSSVGASVLAADNGYLTISGRITDHGVQLHPAVASATARTGTADSSATYSLRILTASGQTMNVPFDTQQLADSRVDVSHFRVSFANPGDISDIDVLANGKVVSKIDRSVRRAVAATAANLQTTQNAGKLALRWNADAEPYAAVLYVAADGRKTVIASALTGGSTAVDVSALPAGGRFEVSLSSSVRGRMVKVARQ